MSRLLEEENALAEEIVTEAVEEPGQEHLLHNPVSEGKKPERQRR